MEQTKNTPRDFFIHLSAFVLLYFIAIAFVTLIFSLINYRFPDPLSFYYVDPYSGAVRFAIASLIILSPAFYYLMRMIQAEARINPERAKLSMRKWLTYITLFIAGATAIGDLIILLNSFLGGELPTAFALKALTILVVAGGAVWYFLLDLRGYWQTSPEKSSYIGYGFLGAVLASIVLGFGVLGSPTTQRDYRLDAQRANDLAMIQSEVVTFWQNNKTLPPSLDTLRSDVSFVPFSLTDPETGEPYTYNVKGDLSFELCATFDRESANQTDGEFYPQMPGISEGTNWEHTAGRTCFERTIDPNLIKPIEQKVAPFELAPVVIPQQ